jgi:hypothetical protein
MLIKVIIEFKIIIIAIILKKWLLLQSMINFKFMKKVEVLYFDPGVVTNVFATLFSLTVFYFL